jgi:hypothetical protein
MTTESYWSYGVVPWLFIIGGIGLGLVLLTAGGVVYEKRAKYSDGLGKLLAICAGIVLLIMVAISLVGYYPYRADYHRWYHVSGIVTESGNRLIPSSDGKSVQQRVVLVINKQPYGVDDTRATVVKSGDYVDLSCKKEFQFNGVSGWACNWGWNPR